MSVGGSAAKSQSEQEFGSSESVRAYLHGHVLDSNMAILIVVLELLFAEEPLLVQVRCSRLRVCPQFGRLLTAMPRTDRCHSHSRCRCSSLVAVCALRSSLDFGRVELDAAFRGAAGHVRARA